jgi:sigma-B regulation protein RsbU (phosphoserine phosphatase)
LYKFKEREPDKKDLKPLQDAVSLRLGHKPETTYTDASAEVGPGDVIVMFTDGFVECTNKEKEEYGNRRFIKSMLKSAKTPTEEIRDGIVKAAMEHYAGQPLGDDLTLVCARVHPEGAVLPEPVPAAAQTEETAQTETTTTAA